MEIYDIKQSRNEYIKTQIDRSIKKILYCKVSIKHVKKWRTIIRKKILLKELGIDKIKGPIICLGTRNGREIDLFRISFFSNKFLSIIVELLEIKRFGWKSIFPIFEKIGRSNAKIIREKSILGVELNPLGKRKDVHIGSFDNLPKKWENKFNIIYSNSFDQSFNPEKTAKEWIRIAKNNSLFILSFTETKPVKTDPVGNLNIDDFIKLFPGEIIFYEKYSSNYNDLIIRIKK